MAELEVSPEAKRGVGLARREVQTALVAGQAIMCPCCDRPIQKIRRTINRTMVEALRFMRDKGPVFPKDMPAAVQKNRDYPRLAYWHLAEKVDIDIGKGQKKQAWRITLAGRNFLSGDLKVPRYVFVFADEAIERSENDLVTVHECSDAPDGEKLAPKFERRIGGMGDVGL